MSGGYRDAAEGGGARIRADVVECHVVRRVGDSFEFLLLRRVKEPLRGTWQPVLGHCERGEGSLDCAIRELREEIGLCPFDDAMSEGMFALEQVRPFYVWRIDAVVLGPRFVVVMRSGFEPSLNGEHDGSRWCRFDVTDPGAFWFGQREALREIEWLLRDGNRAAREALRVVR